MLARLARLDGYKIARGMDGGMEGSVRVASCALFFEGQTIWMGDRCTPHNSASSVDTKGW